MGPDMYLIHNELLASLSRINDVLSKLTEKVDLNSVISYSAKVKKEPMDPATAEQHEYDAELVDRLLSTRDYLADAIFSITQREKKLRQRRASARLGKPSVQEF